VDWHDIRKKSGMKQKKNSPGVAFTKKNFSFFVNKNHKFKVLLLAKPERK
jgi:hypothetical protein